MISIRTHTDRVTKMNMVVGWQYVTKEYAATHEEIEGSREYILDKDIPSNFFKHYHLFQYKEKKLVAVYPEKMELTAINPLKGREKKPRWSCDIQEGEHLSQVLSLSCTQESCSYFSILHDVYDLAGFMPVTACTYCVQCASGFSIPKGYTLVTGIHDVAVADVACTPAVPLPISSKFHIREMVFVSVKHG